MMSIFAEVMRSCIVLSSSTIKVENYCNTQNILTKVLIKLIVIHRQIKMQEN